MDNDFDKVANSLIEILGKNKVIKQSETLYEIDTNLIYNSQNETIQVFLGQEKEGMFLIDYGKNLFNLDLNIDELPKQKKALLNEFLIFNNVSFHNNMFYIEVSKDSLRQGLSSLLAVLLILPSIFEIKL